MERPDFKHLVKNRRYRVARPFTDYDGKLHERGESFVYRGHGFLPYDDGLTLEIDPGGSIRLHWTKEAQGPIIDSLEDYIVEK